MMPARPLGPSQKSGDQLLPSIRRLAAMLVAAVLVLLAGSAGLLGDHQAAAQDAGGEKRVLRAG